MRDSWAVGTFVVVLLAALLGATAAPAGAGASVDADALVQRFLSQPDPLAAPDLGPGWEGTSVGYALRDRVARINRGTRLDWDTCSFESTSVATALRPTQASRVRATNDALCLELLEIGRLPQDREDAAMASAAGTCPAPLSAEDPDTCVSGSSTLACTGDGCGGTEPIDGAGVDVDCAPKGEDACPPNASFAASEDAAAAAEKSGYWIYQGYGHAWYEEVARIDVAALKSYVLWRVKHPAPPGCVTEHGGGFEANPYEPSGWYVYNYPHSVGGHDCAHAWTSTKAIFKNPSFCQTITGGSQRTPTKAFFDRNVARGMVSGIVVVKTTRFTRGGCKNALTFYNVAVRTDAFRDPDQSS